MSSEGHYYGRNLEKNALSSLLKQLHTHLTVTVLMQRRQCIVLQDPPCFSLLRTRREMHEIGPNENMNKKGRKGVGRNDAIFVYLVRDAYMCNR